MAVYLFTFHGFKTWMPDHPRGYTRREEGYLPPDEETARQYEENAASDEVVFDRVVQHILIEETQVACKFQRLHLHAGSTERTHVHILVSWKGFREWSRVRAALKSSLSRRLARESENDSRDATRRGILKLSRGGSRKWVRHRKHFDHLMNTYLPDHRGVKWFEDRGWT